MCTYYYSILKSYVNICLSVKKWGWINLCKILYNFLLQKDTILIKIKSGWYYYENNIDVKMSFSRSKNHFGKELYIVFSLSFCVDKILTHVKLTQNVTT